MPQLTVFYSWQSDHPSKVCRDFIKRALDQAAEAVTARRGFEVRIDSDTQGVPGTPPVSDTILRKIAACDIFLADMTFVASTEGGKKTPNPNVMVEYGYALSERGVSNILLVMNGHFGPGEALPFDLRHLRHPLRYDLDPTTPDAARRKLRAAFAEQLASAIETILDARSTETVVVDPTLRERLYAQAIATQNARITNAPPIIVSSPHAAVFLVPAAVLEAPRLNLQAVAQSRHLLAPDVTSRIEEGQDQQQWWACGAPRRVGNRLNPEADWSSRLLRPGVLELYVSLGRRIDDDRDIVIDGRKAEGALVRRIDRGLALLAAVGLPGPTLIAMALYGLEDAKLFSARSIGRFQAHQLGFEAIVIPRDVEFSGSQLRPLLDDLWLAGGRSEGSPSYGDDGRWQGYETPDLYVDP